MPNSFSDQLRLIINDSREFIAKNFNQMATLCLPILFLTTVVGSHLAQLHQSTLNVFFVPFVLTLLVYPIYTAALIQLMIAKARHENPTNAQLLFLAVRQWAPLFLLKLIMVAMIVAGSVLIIPGLYLWVRLSFAEFYLVVFGHAPLKSIEMSLRTTGAFGWTIFIIFLACYVPIVILDLFFQSFIRSISNNLYLGILSNTIFSFLALFVVVILFRIFMESINRQQETMTSSAS